MKKTIILLSMVGLNVLSASAINIEKATTDRAIINILIKNDLLVVRENRKARESRVVRENRVIHMGRNSRGVRPDRISRMVYRTLKKKKDNLSEIALIEKNHLSKLSR